jgi:hypothetical protein
VTVDLETLLGMPGHGQAVLARFGLIPTKTAARVSCEALVRLVVKHGHRVLNVGRAQRLVTGRQRAALAATYDTCVVPGCGVRFADCDIHHLWWWRLQGPTDLDLQVPLCRSHHTWLHDGGYTITREDGLLVFRDPRGRTITNTTDVLSEQLDLLHQQHDRQHAAGQHAAGRQARSECDGWAAQPASFSSGPPAPPDMTSKVEISEAASAEATAALQHLDGWAATPYRSGAWGWTGPNPAPPPGHAPPTAN